MNRFRTLWLLALLAFVGCTPVSTDLLGSWGGDHVALTVEEAGGWLEFDCAAGEIHEPLVPDATGRFEVTGVFIPDHGGPMQEGEEPERLPARYSGRVVGRTMTLTVTLMEADEEIGRLELRKGEPPQLLKCL